MGWNFPVYWEANYIADEYLMGVPKGGATRFIYTSKDAPVEADEHKRVCDQLEHKLISLVQAQKEIVGLRYYIAEIEKHLSPDEIEKASARASEKAKQVEVQP